MNNCNRLAKTFKNFLHHGWIIPLILNIFSCVLLKIFSIFLFLYSKISKNILRELFPHLKLKDDNVSLLKKIYVYLSVLVNIYVVVWISLYLLLPYIAKESYTNENMTFYMHEVSDDKNVSQYFEKVGKYIANNVLYDKKSDINFHLFNDDIMYSILNPIEWLPNRQTFGATYNKTVFIKNADISKNKTYASNNTDENLDAILLHEGVHALQTNRYGWLYTSFMMPYWVKEGYPIYSARPLSLYGEKEIIEYITKTKDVAIKYWSIFAQDQFNGFMVKHAIEKMHKSVDDLHQGKVDYDEVLDSLLAEYNISK